MKTKKINITFIGLAVVFAVAGLVHTLWVYLSWILADNYNSSAPAEVAFCIIVPYLLVSIAILVAWQLYKKIVALQSRGDFKKLGLYFSIAIVVLIAAGIVHSAYYLTVVSMVYLFAFIPYVLVCIVLLTVWYLVIKNKLKHSTN